MNNNNLKPTKQKVSVTSRRGGHRAANTPANNKRRPSTSINQPQPTGNTMMLGDPSGIHIAKKAKGATPSDAAAAAATTAQGTYYSHHGFHHPFTYSHQGNNHSAHGFPSAHFTQTRPDNPNVMEVHIPYGDAPGAGSSVGQTSGSGNNRATGMTVGGATPIHHSRAPPSSVFRNAGGSATNNKKSAAAAAMASFDELDDDDENSPQRILLSLKTPPASFDERDKIPKEKSVGKITAAHPKSPDEPPQIQHSHRQGASAPNTGMSHHQFFPSPNSFLFEPSPRPSPGGIIGTTSIDMAPSFSLFNAPSFDSLSEGANYFGSVVGPLEAFNSFGGGGETNGEPGQSKHGKTQVLHEKDSLSASQQPTPLQQYPVIYKDMSGDKHFPTMPYYARGQNMSFGNAPPGVAQGGMIMLEPSPNSSLVAKHHVDSSNKMKKSGGSSSSSGKKRHQSSHQTTSPQQAIKKVSLKPQQASSLVHSSRGSSKAKLSPMSSSVRHDSPGKPLTPIYPGMPMSGDTAVVDLFAPLIRIRFAFEDCKFLLPSLHKALIQYPYKKKGDASEVDLVKAKRRVKAAICAFGGNCYSKAHVMEKVNNMNDNPPPISRTNAELSYAKILQNRFYENDARLSWEFEESPPVEVSPSTDDESVNNYGSHASNFFPPASLIKKGENSTNLKAGVAGSSVSSTKKDIPGTLRPDGTKAKMRYRCKLCGQPKQNHICPYQQSLQRSIGVMVYPAVNAFTAHEPGQVAPSLSEMNNFVALSDSDNNSVSPERPTSSSTKADDVKSPSNKNHLVTVTPETIRGATSNNNTKTLNSNTAATDATTSSPSSKLKHVTPPRTSSSSIVAAGRSPSSSEPFLFVDSVDLKHEQYRIVTPSIISANPGSAYKYTPLPLPYAQRKRLSDNLFAFSKQQTELTDECAVVLREAREKDMWDIAVAELLTQVVVVTHCKDNCAESDSNNNDTTLEGLRQYLLTLGIAC